MNLHHIKQNFCPVCLSRTVKELQTHKHANGQWFEERHFECGCYIEHIPNFNETRTGNPCPKSKEIIDKFNKRKAVLTKLEKYITRLDVDDQFKARIFDNMSRII